MTQQDNCPTSNIIKASELVEQSAHVQNKLIGSLNDITAEGILVFKFIQYVFELEE